LYTLSDGYMVSLSDRKQKKFEIYGDQS
jgi:hypothetical protein